MNLWMLTQISKIFIKCKQQKAIYFISLLSWHLEADGQVAHTRTGYADTVIVSHAASQEKMVNVATEDTDLDILIL